LEVFMSAKVRRRIPIHADENSVKRREELDAMLTAIANAIAAGTLPPDDAWAWARIAASGVDLQDVVGVAVFGPERH
jgi:hypothetical protein